MQTNIQAARTLMGLDVDFKETYSSQEWCEMNLTDQKEAIRESPNGRYVEVSMPDGMTFRFRMGEDYDEVVMWCCCEKGSEADRTRYMNAMLIIWDDAGYYADVEYSNMSWVATFTFN